MRPFLLRGLLLSSVEQQEPEPTLRVIGDVYNKTTWANLSDFTTTGMTPSISSGAIVLSGGGNDFNQSMYFGTPNSDENLSFTVEFTINTIGDGIMIGRNSVAYSDRTTALFLDCNSDQLIFFGGGIDPIILTAGLSMANGHNIRITYAQRKNNLTLTATNLTNSNTKSFYLSANYGASKNFVLSDVAKMTIWNIGGNMSITKIHVYSNTLKDPDLVCIGDSKTIGYSTESPMGRWSEMQGVLNTSIFGGDGDQTSHIQQGIAYITANITPCPVLLAIACNDLRGSVPSGTWQANYASIVSTLTTAGFSVGHMLPFPEGSLDQSSLKSWINSNYPSSTRIDPSVGWSNSVHLSPDGVHPSYRGNQFAIELVRDENFITVPELTSSKVFDSLSTPLFAWSMRRVSDKTFVIPGQIRRADGHTFTHFFGEDGWLDTAALATFNSGTTCTLEQLFDQSNNQRTVGNAQYPGDQPRISNSGTFDTINGKPAIRFNGVVSNVNGSINLNSSLVTYFAVVQVDNFSTMRTIMGGFSGNSFIWRMKTDGKQNLVRAGAFELGSSNSAISAATPTVVSVRLDTANGTANFRKNGVDDGTISFSTFSYSGHDIGLGITIADAPNYNTMLGLIGECIGFSGWLNDSNTLAMEREIGAAWGISVA